MKTTVIIRTPDDLALLLRRLEQLQTDGTAWCVEWSKHTGRRKDAQNRLLWLWNNAIQAHMRESTGMIASAEDWHEVMCRRLMPVQARTMTLPDGTVQEFGRWRSSQAGVREMAEYLGLLEAYCAEHLGLYLPHPADSYHEAMMSRGR